MCLESEKAGQFLDEYIEVLKDRGKKIRECFPEFAKAFGWTDSVKSFLEDRFYIDCKDFYDSLQKFRNKQDWFAGYRKLCSCLCFNLSAQDEEEDEEAQEMSVLGLYTGRPMSV
ncbi:hypothetical protein ACFLY6_03080 [Candidatus Dependentiae bacterium]